MDLRDAAGLDSSRGDVFFISLHRFLADFVCMRAWQSLRVKVRLLVEVLSFLQVRREKLLDVENIIVGSNRVIAMFTCSIPGCLQGT